MSLFKIRQPEPEPDARREIPVDWAVLDGGRLGTGGNGTEETGTGSTAPLAVPGVPSAAFGGGTGTPGGIPAFGTQVPAVPGTGGDPAGTPEGEAAGTGEAGTPGTAGRVLRAAAAWAGQQAAGAGRSAGAAVLKRAETPGTMTHRMWNYQPATIAASHSRAVSREFIQDGRDRESNAARRAEIQLHIAGKPLKVAGNALNALGDSVHGQRVAAVLFALAVIITLLSLI